MTLRPEDIPELEETQAVRDVAGESTSTEKSKRRHWYFWPIRLLIIGVFVVVFGVALLPWFLSTGPGTSFLLSRINQAIPGTVQANDVNLAWVGGQSLSGVTLLDPQGNTVVTLDELKLPDAGLWKLIRKSPNLGGVSVAQGTVELVMVDPVTTNLEQALGVDLFSDKQVQQVRRLDANDGHDIKPAAFGLSNTPTLATASPSSEPALSPDLFLQLNMREVKLTLAGAGFETVAVSIPVASTQIHGPTQISFTLNTIVTQGGNVGTVKLAGSCDHLFDEQGYPSLGDATLSVDGRIDHMPLRAIDRLLGEDSRLEALLGDKLDAHVRLEGPTAMLNGELAATADRLKVYQTIVSGGSALTGGKESLSTLSVTPQSWREFTDAQAGELLEPFEVTFEVTGFNAPRRELKLDMDSATFAARWVVGALAIEMPDRGLFKLERWEAELTSQSLANEWRFQCDGWSSVNGQAGPIHASAQLKPTARGWAGMRIDAVLDALPISVLDFWLQQGERLTSTLGDSLSMSAVAEKQPDGAYALTANFERTQAGKSVETAASPLTGTLTGQRFPDGAIHLKTQEPITLTVSPLAFEKWQRPVAAAVDAGESVGLALSEPMQIEVAVDLRIARVERGAAHFHPERTGVVLDVKLPQTELIDRWYGRSFTLSDGLVTIDAQDLRRPIKMQMQVQTSQQSDEGAGSRVGRMTGELLLTGAMLDDGYIQLERGVVDGEVKFVAVPTVVFDTLTRQRGYAVAAFGKDLTATLEVQDYSQATGGRLDFELRSENGSLGSLPALVDAQGDLRLRAPATFYLNATPQFSNKILRVVNPVILPAVVSANVPIVITLDDDEFVVPTRSFDWARVNSDASVLMSEVTIAADVSPINKIIPTLIRFNLLEESDLYEADVAPIQLQVRSGVLSYKQLPIAIDDVELNFGGQIDLGSRDVNMVLRLGGEAFEKDDFLKAMREVKIDIGGTTSDPQVNLDSLRQNFFDGLIPGVIKGDGAEKDLLREGAARLLEGLFRRGEEQEQEPELEE